ncbi:MAG TPA: phosphoribosylformylglycinamidine synthase, partial [Candidatus Moranbacteria bacterium]|nr:phosphoribosylformylglycinamidine synthase [Candidatus Moranbacteria bacterium]
MYVFYQRVSEVLEYCYYVVVSYALSSEELEKLKWMLGETFEPQYLRSKSFFTKERVVEIGPRLSATTPWAANTFSACREGGLYKIVRVERSMRYKLASGENEEAFVALHCDRMTQEHYKTPLTTLVTALAPEAVKIVPVLEEGRAALEKINEDMGLSWDDWDIDFNLNLFVNDLKRNSTNVELFDNGQSNSEHCRHWFFRGKIVIDGREMPQTLFEIVKEPWEKNPGNSVIAFKDNS